MLKPSMVWSQQIMENSQTVLKRSEYQNTLPACWEICMQVKKQQLGASRQTSQNCGQQKGSTQGLSPWLWHSPILFRDSGTSWALLGVRLGPVALDACLPTPTSDKTILDFTRIRLAEKSTSWKPELIGSGWLLREQEKHERYYHWKT